MQVRRHNMLDTTRNVSVTVNVKKCKAMLCYLSRLGGGPSRCSWDTTDFRNLCENSRILSTDYADYPDSLLERLCGVCCLSLKNLANRRNLWMIFLWAL